MTEADWNQLKGTLVHLKNCVETCESCGIDLEYDFIKEIVDIYKPFEIEVGKEYVAKFEIAVGEWYDESTIFKNQSVIVTEISIGWQDEYYVLFENIKDYGSTEFHPIYKKYIDEFKASFKPLQND